MSPTNVFSNEDGSGLNQSHKDLQAKADKAELDVRELEASEVFPIRV